MDLLLNKEESFELFDIIEKYYQNINTIEDYYYDRKKEKIIGINEKEYYNYLFDDYNIEPKDMDIEYELIDGKFFNNIVQLVVSIPFEGTSLGRKLNFGLKDKKTNKYVCFIRLSSPVFFNKPRNDLFGTHIKSDKINKFIMTGTIIVPVQPFGFNCLGGKLGALFCTSHQCLSEIKKKYGDKSDICFFETTSIYGDLKENSQYDGLKPFIKNGGMTDSNLLLYPNKDIYFKIRNKVRQFYGKSEWGNSMVDPKKCGPKMMEFNKIISILKLHLKHYDEIKYEEFLNMLKNKLKVKCKKRYYYSTFGYENIINYVNSNGQIELEKKVNFDNYDFNYLINWWKRKSQKRYDKLKKENRLRKNIEIFTLDSINNRSIDMIR